MGLIIPEYELDTTGQLAANAYATFITENSGVVQSVFSQQNSRPWMPMHQQHQAQPWQDLTGSSVTSLTISRSADGLSYTAAATLSVFASNKARLARKQPIGTAFVRAPFDIAAGVNPLAVLYAAAKVQFPDAQDA